MNNFKMKTEVYFGQGALARLEKIGNKKVFVVTDPFMVKSGMINNVTDRLKNADITIFSDIVPDPPIETIVQGIEELQKVKPEVLIALGGGSAIDAAKAIMDFSKKITSVKEMEFIAIPTTSGTGSEVTSFSVITDKAKGTKYPLVSDDLLPDIAILDPELVKSVPGSITADTGMDVITHALEAYVSTNASDFSDALAEKSLVLSFKYLLKAYKDGSDMEAREKMHNASCLAGIAFNAASLGLNHGIAHVLGGKFHVPHGRTNALLLPYIVEFNADIIGYENQDFSRAAEKYATIAKLLGLPCGNARAGVRSLINEIKKLQKEMKMPTTLKACGVSMEDLSALKDEIADLALLDACTATNPKVPTPLDVIEIIGKVKE
ncbi:MAG: 1-propanol dehydrogenase PduQ [Clostridium sp.]|uniref:1-propanol dehydrogenase PduQ n=1 Tax=Clostridium sp. TaxID=1506 RepID=UPI003026DE11